MLHAAQISFFVDPQRRSPFELLRAWPTLVDVAEAASRAGVRVSVIQASAHSELLQRDTVDYHFVESPAQCHGLLRRLKADVFHVHGLDSPRAVTALAAALPNVPILLQDHASRVPRFWRRAAMRRGLLPARGIAFCAATQAQPFIDAGLVHSKTRIYEIPESTTRFTMGDRLEARRLTGVTGKPALLWVGHLDSNKDPLTVLQGVSDAARDLPELKLYCCFASAPLLGAVQAKIASDPLLRTRVHLLGPMPHERIELLMRAADKFVLGSHREGSGYSLIEALACGLFPVVTDIPSFRSLTADGAVAKLWDCGDTAELCKALLANADGMNRATVRAYFERELSFDALGKKLGAAYDDLRGPGRVQ